MCYYPGKNIGWRRHIVTVSNGNKPDMGNDWPTMTKHLTRFGVYYIPIILCVVRDIYTLIHPPYFLKHIASDNAII